MRCDTLALSTRLGFAQGNLTLLLPSPIRDTPSSGFLRGFYITNSGQVINAQSIGLKGQTIRLFDTDVDEIIHISKT